MEQTDEDVALLSENLDNLTVSTNQAESNENGTPEIQKCSKSTSTPDKPDEKKIYKKIVQKAISHKGGFQNAEIKTPSRTQDSFVRPSSTHSLIKKPSRTSRASNLRQFIRQKRKEGVLEATVFVKDEYETARSASKIIKKSTGVVFEDNFSLHDCPWDSNYPENSKRYKAVLERCNDLGLIDRCIRIKGTPAKEECIEWLHGEKYAEKLFKICQKSKEDMEKDASNYDAIYFNEHTYNAALLAAGSAINLVDAVCKDTIKNGMAIVRPPGHHAMTDNYCGYCYFNNVAIAAEHALRNNLATKILVVDFDVHHGQATQQMFYEDNRVLYFSIHRYEFGAFWPNLKESNFDHIGSGLGKFFNINVPLNQTGLGDSDYFSIVYNILLPVAYKFQPNLILFSAGYDACIGCPEGEMKVTPGFYGHLISLLSGLACGKLVVCLEGGYFLPSLAEGAAMTLKGLLGDPLPLLKPMEKPAQSVIDIINSLKKLLSTRWTCFKNIESVSNLEKKILGVPGKPPFLTRNCYPVQDKKAISEYTRIVNFHKNENNKLDSLSLISVAYDSDMGKHMRIGGGKAFYCETPERVTECYKLYEEWGSNKRCLNLPAKAVTGDILKLIHETNYVDKIMAKKFDELIVNKNDMFYNNDTLLAIEKSVGCLLAVIDSVMTRESSAGFAIIRPPGHHAEYDKASGFCYCNNVAVATKYIQKIYGVKKVLIVDFDVHHGNGTQNLFYNDDNVMYISVHRFDNGEFFPGSVEADYNYSGEGRGQGFNVNIPFNSGTYGNYEYLTVFTNIVLPIAYSFAPEIVIISAGFDAGINDMLGNYKVTPECFGHFVQLLKGLANGKIIMALEGGYNICTLSHSVNICIKTLLGDPLPQIDLKKSTLKVACMKTITKVVNHQNKFWPHLLPLKDIQDETKKTTEVNKDDAECNTS